MEKLKIVYKKLADLVEPDYNPRKASAKQKQDIKTSLDKFGFIQPLVVNVHPDRLNILIGGNQRRKIAMNAGIEQAPCVEVHLEEKEEKELNLRLNKNQAEFDIDILNEFFDKPFLLDVGFTENEIGRVMTEFEENFNAITNNDAEMPLVPKWSEKYDSIIIFSDNELDFNYLKNVLEITKAKDYKNTRVGESHVIHVKDFQKIMEKMVERAKHGS